MNKRNYYFDQGITDTDLRDLETRIETADKNIVKDIAGSGIISGLTIVPNTPADFTVRYLHGVAYDAYGQRVESPGDGSVNCVANIVSTAGKERWLTIVGRFARNDYDTVQDGNGQDVLYKSDEFYQIAVLVGDLANIGSAAKPAASTGDIILADVRMYYGQANIAAGDIDGSRRINSQNGPLHTHPNATQTTAGFMSAPDKTKVDNTLSKDGTIQMTGPFNEAVGSSVASAATINLTAATGNLIHITGTQPISTVILGAGMRRTVIFDGALTLTHHATNNNLPGGANITTAAGDRAEYWSDGTTVYCTNYTKANGQSIISGITPAGWTNLRAVNTTGYKDTKITVTADEVILNDAAGNPTRKTNVSFTIDTAAAGAGGMDTGLRTGLAANADLYWFGIYNPTTDTFQGLWSASLTPTLPSGYTKSILGGGWKVDNTANRYLMRIQQLNDEFSYVPEAGTNTPDYPQLASGTSAKVSISLASVMPVTAWIADIRPYPYYSNITLSTNNVVDLVSSNVPGGWSEYFLWRLKLETARTIWWKSDTQSGNKLHFYGWKDNCIRLH